MSPATLGSVVVDGAIAIARGAAKLGCMRMFDAQADLSGFVIELHVGNGPRRRKPEHVLVKVFVVRGVFSAESFTESTIDPDGPAGGEGPEGIARTKPVA